MSIHNLIRESMGSVDVEKGRPSLLALTRATTKLIYTDLVAIQPTDSNVAALFGVKYLNPNDELSFITGATYSGAIGTEARKTLPDMTVGMTLAKGDYFKYQDVVLKALVDNPFAGTTETDLFDILSEAIAGSAVRMVPDAAETSHFEVDKPDIAEAGFTIDKWTAPAKTRKLQTQITVELAQDLNSNGFEPSDMLEDILATQMAEEINKDVMQSMITVSKRFKVKGISDKGVLDLSVVGSSVEQARDLFRYICEMNADIQRNTSYSATFVQASSRVAALLTSSGWMQKKDDQPESAYGVLNNGLVLYCDNNSPVEYVIVGVKDEFGDAETIGSLFYAPYVDGLSEEADIVDHIGAYKVLRDPASLQPKIMLQVRYALCVNPYTMGLDDPTARNIDASNMDNFAGQSQMSVLLGVKLPKLVTV
ncbi:gp24 head vertex protein [Acinetobacter phage 133]|uniref:Capsid vertex protein n=1 Tax=Acinetobacter phage 133 TaxID=2919552 RepID=D9I6B4_9CAUD|nr:gp24 head vertex protein [Acinetobacter phage 133]ADJ19495.1 gp24 head vertex protein [Acinetobacter phage 133]